MKEMYVDVASMFRIPASEGLSLEEMANELEKQNQGRSQFS